MIDVTVNTICFFERHYHTDKIHCNTHEKEGKDIDYVH